MIDGVVRKILFAHSAMFDASHSLQQEGHIVIKRDDASLVGWLVGWLVVGSSRS